jgi:tmRNA-binding protein
MAAFIIIVVLPIALALAAGRWGFDSREKLESPEWERRLHRRCSSI